MALIRLQWQGLTNVVIRLGSFKRWVFWLYKLNAGVIWSFLKKKVFNGLIFPL